MFLLEPLSTSWKEQTVLRGLENGRKSGKQGQETWALGTDALCDPAPPFS